MPIFVYRIRTLGGVLSVGSTKNQLTNQALAYLASACFNSQSVNATIGDIVVGGIDGDGYSTRSRSDTWSSHPGWVALSAEEQEFSFDTDGWNDITEEFGFGGTAAGQLVLNDGDVLKGFYMRNSTGTVLWSTAELQIPVIASGETLVDIFYFINEGTYEE